MVARARNPSTQEIIQRSSMATYVRSCRSRRGEIREGRKEAFGLFPLQIIINNNVMKALTGDQQLV